MNKKYKIGDILFNPSACDLWIVSERYNEEKSKDELFIVLVHSDYFENIEIANSFIKVGNIYELVEFKDNLIEYLEDKINKLKDECASYGHTIDYDIAEYIDIKIEVYQDILERVKNNNYD